jgi:hypothetical protein
VGDAAPFVVLELDKPRKMFFTFGVRKKFQEITGQVFEEIDEESMGFNELSVLLYLMLAVEDKELTQEQVDDLLHYPKLNDYVAKIEELMQISNPEASTSPKAASSQPSSSSGASEKSASA